MRTIELKKVNCIDIGDYWTLTHYLSRRFSRGVFKSNRSRWYEHVVTAYSVAAARTALWRINVVEKCTLKYLSADTHVTESSATVRNSFLKIGMRFFSKCNLLLKIVEGCVKRLGLQINFWKVKESEAGTVCLSETVYQICSKEKTTAHCVLRSFFWHHLPFQVEDTNEQLYWPASKHATLS